MKGDEGTTQTYIKGVRNAVKGTTLDALRHRPGGRQPRLLGHERPRPPPRRGDHLHARPDPAPVHLPARSSRRSCRCSSAARRSRAAPRSSTLIGKTTDTSVFALNVASMIGLGLAIDFSLIVVSRFREELAKRGDTAAAVEMTMATAGRSILYSGVTVMLGMIVLSAARRPDGDPVDQPRRPRRRRDGAPRRAHAAAGGARDARAEGGAPARLAEAPAEARDPGLLVPLEPLDHAPPVGVARRLARAHRRARAAGAQPEDARLDGEAPAAETPSRVQGLDYINSQFGNNALNPIQIVLKTKPGGVFTPKFLTGLDKLSNTLAADRRAEQRDVARHVHGRRAALRRALPAPEAGLGLLAGAELRGPGRRTSRRRGSS